MEFCTYLFIFVELPIRAASFIYENTSYSFSAAS